MTKEQRPNFSYDSAKGEDQTQILHWCFKDPVSFIELVSGQNLSLWQKIHLTLLFKGKKILPKTPRRY